MGDVVPLRPETDRKAQDAWEAARTALLRAQSTGRLVDMREAVLAFEAFLVFAVPDEAARKRFWR